MRVRFAYLGAALALVVGCGKGEDAGAEEARREAEAEQKKKVAEGGAAQKMKPPVANKIAPDGTVIEVFLPCEQLIDAAAFQTALGELEPIKVVDSRKTEPEAAGSCSLIRGGTRPSEAEQKKRLKEEGRLGVLPGDEICNVTTYCRTIEDPEKFRARCDPKNREPDNSSMGNTFACKQRVAVGADDVFVWRFFDEDTKCIFQVKGGPSQVDAELTRKCAIAARDTIGPAQLVASDSPPPAPETDSDEGGETK